MRKDVDLARPDRPIKPAESVVAMSVYKDDRVEWVEQAVNSILNQTYTNFMFCIVVDGPVSDAISICLADLEAKDERIVLLLGHEQCGLSARMNTIIEWTAPYAPKYFFRMDADDISLPERLHTQVQFLEQHPEVSILGSALSEINENGTVVGSRKLPLQHKKIVRLLPRRCSLNHPTVVLRYAVFDAGHRYREDLMNTQDFFLWIELAASGYRFENLKTKLLMFRRVNDFYKRRGLDKSINEFKARLFAMKRLKKFEVSNMIYAIVVLSLRLMPSKVVKLAYKLDRLLLDKLVKH